MTTNTSQNTIDLESTHSLQMLSVDPKIVANRVPGVQSVLYVLSAKGMVYDVHSLKQKTQHSYPGAKVYFVTQLGLPVGEVAPKKLDLIVDFTGPRTRQGLFIARKWRRLGRVVLGRNSGFFRAGRYDKIFDEKSSASVPSEQMDRERFVQRMLLEMAGVAMIQAGDSSPDRGKLTPLTLPPLQR